MLSIFNTLRGIDFLSLLVKLVLSVLCGTAIGLERSAKNRPAGFRTHILVCLGGAVAALTGHFLYLGLKLPADITRISGQVITGLGFIGAGTIIVTKKMTIKGLTTAAGLWATGIIGLAIGSGFYEGGIFGTGLVLAIETSFTWISQRIKKTPEFSFEILYNEKEALDHVMRYCKDQRTSIKNLHIHSETEGPAKYSAVLFLRSDKERETLLNQICLIPGVVSATEL